MNAGRELDALVAEKVMELKVDYEFADIFGAPSVPALRDKYDEMGFLPEYSTDIGAAWQVVEKLRETRFGDGYPGTWTFWVASDMAMESERKEALFDDEPHRYEVEHFFNNGSVNFTVWADTMPLAICLAALKAKGVEV